MKQNVSSLAGLTGFDAMLRLVLLASLVLGISNPILAAEDPLVGTWRSSTGQFLDFRADGHAFVHGSLTQWRVVNRQLVFSSSDGQITMPFTLSGSHIIVQTEEGIDSYFRYEKAVPVALAADPASNPSEAISRTEALRIEAVTGVWLGPEGTTFLSPGGIGKAQGLAFAWDIEGQSLVMRQGGKQVQVSARLEGGKLILQADPEVTLTRSIGAAGWWSAWDGAVDVPQVESVSVTHHLALLPDGRVRYVTGKPGAARPEGWFTTTHEDAAIQVVGQWEQRGEDVQFALKNVAYQAFFDEKRQIVRVSGLGQIKPATELIFARE